MASYYLVVDCRSYEQRSCSGRRGRRVAQGGFKVPRPGVVGRLKQGVLARDGAWGNVVFRSLQFILQFS